MSANPNPDPNLDPEVMGLQQDVEEARKKAKLDSDYFESLIKETEILKVKAGS